MRIATFICALSIALVSYVDSAAFEVRHTSGSGSGSLHQAILDANAAPNIMGWPDRITFNIPGTGPHVFVVPADTLLPAITDPVVIDGYSQPGASANTNDWTTCTSDLGTSAIIMIQIDGTATSASTAPVNNVGLHVQSDDCTIAGLSITNFYRVFAPVDGIGIWLDGCSGNQIVGCFVGVPPAGTPSAPNLRGIEIDDAPNNTVGGTTALARNLIANYYSGVLLQGTGSTGNVIQGNLFGTDVDGLQPLPGPLPLLNGIEIDESTDNLIGGTLCEERNVIGHHKTGVYAFMGERNTISMNYIGVNLVGQLDPHADAIPNDIGIRLKDCIQNTIGGTDAGNIVAHQSFDGVVITHDSDGNTITQNTITRNGQMGIDLNEDDVSSPDYLDADTGPNRIQNFPENLSAIKASPSSIFTHVTGTLHSHPDTEYRIEIFTDFACDAMFLHGEGETYYGSDVVMTDHLGDADFKVTAFGLSIGDVITSTATDFLGNTSEFSECGQVVLGIRILVEHVIWLNRANAVYFLKLPIVNDTQFIARSVTGTLMPGSWAGWLTVVDSTSDYGDVVGGGKSMGDVYSLDLSQWPGGSFYVLVRLDHENNQGTPMTTVVPVRLVPDDWASSSDGDSPPPASIVLRSHPNPAAFSTTLSFEMPREGLVELDVFNARGQRVRSLLRESRGAGTYDVEWDGRDRAGRTVASGVYYVQLRVGGEIASQKQVILR